MDRELENTLTWFKREKLKDEEKSNRSKESFIKEIKKKPKERLQNTVVVDKKYTLWERLKQTLGMN